MKRTLLQFQYNRLAALYQKLNSRMNKHFASGRFHSFSKQQQYKLIKRLEKLRYRLNRLEQNMKLAGVAAVACLILNSPGAYAQSQPVSVGSEFLVNTFTTNHQRNPSVTMDDNGNFVIVWNGRVQGNEFRVNTHTTDFQGNLSIARDGDGDFVIVWESDEQDGSSLGIYAQRYEVNQAPLIANQDFSIDEDKSIGTSVGTVVVSDPDAGQTLSYAITAGNTDDVFAINSVTGEITVAGTLDYETLSSYTLTVEVSDNGTPVLSNSATITITINDVTETGVVSAYENNTIRVYPNPSAGELLITSDAFSLEGYRMTISNMIGEAIFESTYTKSISLHHLSKGVYLLRLEGEGKVIVKQVVVR